MSESKRYQRRARMTIGVLSVTIVGLMMLSLLSICVQPKPVDIPTSIKGSPVQPSEDHWYYYYGFYWDDRTIGTWCDKSPGFGYTNVPAQGNITVNYTSFDDSIVMKLNKTETTNSMYANYYREVTGKWQIEFRLAVETAGVACALWLFDDAVPYVAVGFETSKIVVWDGANTFYDTINAKEWYNITLQVDSETDTYSAYVNNALIEAGNLNGDITTISDFELRMGTSSSGVVYMDDFIISAWAEYDYQTDDLTTDLIDGLDYVMDYYYNPGATGIYNGTGIITGYPDETNRSYPRIVVASCMDAAITAYEITLLKKYYDMALDIGRWLVDVAQDSSGYFPFFGGTDPNMPNNVLTSMEVAEKLLHLYELTANSKWLTSALSAMDYIITNCWNSTLELLRDYPGSSQSRINVNAVAAKDLAFAYYLTGNTNYRNYAITIVNTLPSYQESGNCYDDDYVNYSGCGWYPHTLTDETNQSWAYEGVTAWGIGGAIYWLIEAGVSPASISTGMDAFQKSIFGLTGYFWYDVGLNESSHQYGEAWMGYVYYALLNDAYPQFDYMPQSMVEFMTDRAIVNLTSGVWIPRNWYYIAPSEAFTQPMLLINRLGDFRVYGELDDFTQPYRLSQNSTIRLMLTPSGSIEIDDISQDSTSLYWTSTASSSVTYTLANLASTSGYRVYLDGEVIATGLGPLFSFTSALSGEFEVQIWYERQVSALIVLTVNMVGLGIIVTVLASYIAPIANDIREKRPIRPEKLTQNLIRTVIFIVVASLMWGVLHSIAIG